MELVAELVSPAWRWGAGAGIAVLLAYACGRAPWWWLRQAGAMHVYLGALTGILLIWQIRAGIGTGPYLHLLGGTLLTLAFGWQLAFIGLVIVILGDTAFGGGDWPSFGINALVSGLVPVAVAYRFARIVERVGRNFFVYVFGIAFAGGAVSIVAVAAASVTVLLSSNPARADFFVHDYLPTWILLLFPEAFVTGGLLTLAVVYRPSWIVSFDDRRYLDGH